MKRDQISLAEIEQFARDFTMGRFKADVALCAFSEGGRCADHAIRSSMRRTRFPEIVVSMNRACTPCGFLMVLLSVVSAHPRHFSSCETKNEGVFALKQIELNQLTGVQRKGGFLWNIYRLWK